LAGFLKEMAASHALVPLLWTSGGAGGLVTRDAFERITGVSWDGLSEAMPVDAVYLDLHGAMVTEDFEDGEGEVLRRVRAAVGSQVPIVTSLDYHANVTPDMVAHTDALIAYRTYPHVDRVETGQYAARAMQALLERGRPSGRALRKPPFLIPLNGQCTLVEPSKSIAASSKVVEGDLVNLSYLAGFPPSDLQWCGPSVVAHAWTQQAADLAADEMLALVEAQEVRFAEKMVSPEEGVARAIAVARHRQASRGDRRYAGQPRLRRHVRFHRIAQGARRRRRATRGARLPVRCRGGAGGARGRGGRRGSTWRSAAAPAPRA
jgi:microcystin degradation protein MlrC